MLLGQILLSQGILAACVLLGWFFGRRIHRFANNRFADGDLGGHELGRMTDTLAFVGGAVGILLGLLLSFSVSQFSDTKDSIQSLGQNSVGIFTASQSLDAEQRLEIRRDVICVLHSASTSDWSAIGNGVEGGSPETTAWLLKLNTDVSNLSLTTIQQQQAFGSILSGAMDLSSAREDLVMGNSALIPVVVWIVIYFSAFIMAALLAMHLADRRILALISAAMAWGILAVILFALTVLDSPLAPLLGTPTLDAHGLTSALDILHNADSSAELWAECPPMSK